MRAATFTAMPARLAALRTLDLARMQAGLHLLQWHFSVDLSSAVVPPPSGRNPGRTLHRFANPGRFLRLSGRVLPWLTGAGAA